MIPNVLINPYKLGPIKPYCKVLSDFFFFFLPKEDMKDHQTKISSSIFPILSVIRSSYTPTAHECALMSESPISTYLEGQKGDFNCSGAGSPLSSSFSDVEGGWAQQKVSFSSGSVRVSPDLGDWIKSSIV